MTKANASEAIVSLLKQIEAKPSEPIDLFRIGIPLIVEADPAFTQDEVLNGLLWLQSERVIELTGDNCLKLV